MSSSRLKRRSRRLASGGEAEEPVEQGGGGPDDGDKEDLSSTKGSAGLQGGAGQKRGRDAHATREGSSPKRMRLREEVEGGPSSGSRAGAGASRRGTGGGGRGGKGKARADPACLFRACRFVLSRALERGARERMSALLVEKGAAVEEEIREAENSSLSGRVRQFFVHGRLADERLAEALECSYEVVGPDFVNDCLAHARLLFVQEQALGMDLRRKGMEGTRSATAESSLHEKNEACLWLPSEIFQELVHEPVPPQNREWRNRPQSFNAFLEMPERIVSGPLRTTLYLQPLGWNTAAVTRGSTRSLALLEEAVLEFLSLFFCCPVATLEEREILLDDSNPSGSVEYCVRWEDYMYPIRCSTLIADPDSPGQVSGAMQRLAGARTGRVDRLNAEDVLRVLWDQSVPDDTLAVLALTMHDLYETREDSSQYWGRATEDGFAIASGFRFIPPQISVSRQFRQVAQAAAVGGQGLSARRSSRAGKGKKQCPIKAACGIRRKELARLLNVAARELCHVLGMDHCSYFKCLMNHCTQDPALLDGTLHLCVICLRKLQSALDLKDLVGRYERLLAFLHKHDLSREGAWFRNRLEGIFQGQPPAASHHGE